MSSGDLIPNDHDHVESAANEVQFALVLSRMIDTVNNSPEHMRQAVYDLARYKLTEQFTDADATNIQRAQQALETAIRGVEEFSRQQIGIPPPQVPQISNSSAARIPATDADPPDWLRHPARQIDPVVHSAPIGPIIKRSAAMLIIIGGIFVGLQERGRLAALAACPTIKSSSALNSLAASAGSNRCVAYETCRCVRPIMASMRSTMIR